MKKEAIRTVSINVRLSEETKSELEAQARKKKVSTSEVIRDFIYKGLEVDGYKNELDFITETINTAVKTALSPQIERLVKILMKIGKINGAGYFTQLANLMNASDKTNLTTLEETIQICNRLAIDYMNLRDVNVEKYLMDHEGLFRKALKLKIDDFYSTDDIPDYE